MIKNKKMITSQTKSYFPVLYSHLFFFFLCGLSYSLSADTDITILHTNDIHAHFLPSDAEGQDCTTGDECLGGLARLQTLIDAERNTNPNTLFLNAGDNFAGTFFYTFHKDADFIPLFKNLKFDALTLGNHEFDDPPEILEHFLSQLSTPCINTHIHFPDYPTLNKRLKSSTIITKDTLKIGIIGALTEDVGTSSMHGSAVRVSPVLPSLTAEIQSLKSQGASVLILLSHLGLDKDIDLAQKLPDIDIIIGGHTHNLLSNSQTADGPYPIVVKHPDSSQTLIVSAGVFGRFVGKLKATVDNKGHIISYSGDTVPLSDKVKPDRQTAAFIAKQSADLDRQLNTKLHTLTRPLPMTPGKNYCAEDCPVGSALVHMVLSETPKADIVLINSGAIRAGFNARNILQKHLIQALPFDSTAVLTTMTGAELKAYLETGLKTYQPDQRTNALLQIAGASYRFDPTSQKITELTHHNAAINPTQQFQVVLPLFLAKGGDGFPPLTDYEILPQTLSDMVRSYLLKTTALPTFDMTIRTVE